MQPGDPYQMPQQPVQPQPVPPQMQQPIQPMMPQAPVPPPVQQTPMPPMQQTPMPPVQQAPMPPPVQQMQQAPMPQPEHHYEIPQPYHAAQPAYQSPPLNYQFAQGPAADPVRPLPPPPAGPYQPQTPVPPMAPMPAPAAPAHLQFQPQPMMQLAPPVHRKKKNKAVTVALMMLLICALLFVTIGSAAYFYFTRARIALDTQWTGSLRVTDVRGTDRQEEVVLRVDAVIEERSHGPVLEVTHRGAPVMLMRITDDTERITPVFRGSESFFGTHVFTQEDEKNISSSLRGGQLTVEYRYQEGEISYRCIVTLEPKR